MNWPEAFATAAACLSVAAVLCTFLWALVRGAPISIRDGRVSTTTKAPVWNTETTVSYRRPQPTDTEPEESAE